jgi:methylated-DNA-[protein]-cysteine S-methyltransferase
MEKRFMRTIVDFVSIESPLGPIVLAARADALCGAWFDGQRHQPAIDQGWRQRPALPLFRQAIVELDEYFNGTRTRFDVRVAPAGTAFQQAIWKAIAAVPFGATISYSALATNAGHPGCVRAAGAATGRNPLSIFIPCHRIVGANGALTGYAGGIERKRALLALEGAAASAMRRAA